MDQTQERPPEQTQREPLAPLTWLQTGIRDAGYEPSLGYRAEAIVPGGQLEPVVTVQQNGDVVLDGNDALEDLSGLSGVSTLGSLAISSSDALSDLSGLEGLTGLGDLILHSNFYLTDLSALSSICLRPIQVRPKKLIKVGV